MKKFLAVLLACVSLLSFIAGCGEEKPVETTEPKETAQTQPQQTQPDKQEPNNTEPEPNDWDQDWAGDSIAVQDLGTWELDAFPVDASYDWGSCILNIDGVYKMWWTRSSPWDGVWYAESTDLKNWTNVQLIFRLRSVKENTTYIKQHLADPAVVYVDGKYYFWFETCSTADDYGAAYGDGTIVHATSTDGIHLDWYGGDDPLPVMQPAKEHWFQGLYGSGMPSVIYKDGKFMMYYYDGKFDVMRLAISDDGIHFPENKDCPIVFDKSGAGFTYNTLTGKYMMTICANPLASNPNAVDNEVVYIQESDDGLNWEYSSWREMTTSPLVASADTIKMRCFAEFIKNEHGMVDTPTIYMTYTEGDKPKAGDWWMSTAGTFELHYAAVNLPQYAKRVIDLPNGEKNSEEAIKAYADRVAVWHTRSGVGKYGTPVIDGQAEDIWNDVPAMLVDRVAGAAGMLPTNTRGEVKILWDEDYMYIHAVVTDSVVSYSFPVQNRGDQYHRDGIAIFVDVPRNRENGPAATYTPAQYAINITACGDIVITNPSINLDISDEFDCETVVEITDTGYIIEAKCSWNALVKDMVTENKIIGFDIGINDDMGSGDRDSCVAWSDYAGSGYRDYTVLGNLTLIP